MIALYLYIAFSYGVVIGAAINNPDAGLTTLDWFMLLFSPISFPILIMFTIYNHYFD